MISILHNPRCSKSRNALKLLETAKLKVTIIRYLEKPITKDELRNILKKLKITALELVRTNELLWKDNYKSQNLTNESVLNVMISNPILIQRPILLTENTAIIGRNEPDVEKFIESCDQTNKCM